MNPRPAPTGPARSRKALIVTLSALALLAVAALVAAVAGPRVAEGMARREVQRLAARLQGDVQVDRLELSGLAAAVLGRVAWRDGDDWEAVAEDVRIDVDPFALLVGGRAVRRVTVGRASVRLGSEARPLDGAEGVLRRLRTLRAADTGATGGAEGSGTRWGRLPDVVVASLAGEAYLQGRHVRILDGRAALAPDRDGGVAGRRRMEADLGVDAGDGHSRRVKAAVALDPEGPVSATVDVSPAVSADVAGGTASAGGAAWAPGEASLLDLAWTHPDRGSLRAERVTARWQDGPPEAPAWIDRLPGAAVPAARRLLAGRTLREVEILRPFVDMVVTEPPAGPPAVPAPGAAAPSRPKAPAARAAAPAGPPVAQVRLRGLFQQAATALDDLAQSLASGAARLPDVRIAVHGATVRALEPGATAPRPGQSLVNLEVSVENAPDGTRVAQVSFECPEAPAGANEARVTLDPATGIVTAVLKAAYVPLHPWRPLLPRVLGTRDAVLRQADGTVTLDARRRRLEGSGTTRVTGAVLDLPAVASEPLVVEDATLAGGLVLDWARGTLDMDEGRAALGRLSVPFSLHASDVSERPRVAFQGQVERLPAQDLLDSLPRQVMASLEGVRLAGTFAASIDLAVDTAHLDAVRLDIRPDVADVRTLTLGPAVDLDLLRSVFLHRIEEGDGTVVNRLVGEDTPGWVPLAAIPRYLVDALTTAEDATFFHHKGFSPVGIRRSLKVNLERGGFYQGASTLSQQLVKNLFLSREKTLSRKLQEVFLTWQMEQSLEKEQILELYLNVIEWGPDVWGLREAAGHYFARKPEELTLLEAAWLVAIIPGPRVFHEGLLEGAPPPAFARRARALLAEMGRRKLVPPDDAAAALEEEPRFAPLAAAQPPADETEGDGATDAAADDFPDDEFTE